MKLGLGLPVSDPARLLDWARLAQDAGFHTLGLLDRLAYDNPEPLTALAVLAGATSRIRLQTEVLLGPLRQTALLAKQVATLDRMSGGRFTLGLGLGGRDDDHAAAGTPATGRGAALDRQIADLRHIWQGLPYPASQEAIGPLPVTPGGPPILLGAFAPAALRRVARRADGLLCAASPDRAGGLIDAVREEWVSAGRTGKPRIVCQLNAAIGSPEVHAAAQDAVAAYYSFTGRPGWGAPITDPAVLTDTIATYRELGADEVVLYCYAPDAAQVDSLADLVR